MKELHLNVDNQGRVTPSNYSGFIVGEHNAGRIVVCFSDLGVPKCDYFRMYFETSDGKKVFSKQLQEEGSYIYYDMPFDVTSLGHTLYWQLFGYKMEGEEFSLVYKTEVVPIALGGSLSGEGDLVDESFVSELQVILDKVEGFDKEFSVQVGEVQLVSSSENPSVNIRKNGDYKYCLDFTLPTAPPAPEVPVIKKSYFSIPASGWDENLRSIEMENPYITRTGTIILCPKTESVAAFNDCNVAVYEQDNNSITFCCSKAPQQTISFNALIVEI